MPPAYHILTHEYAPVTGGIATYVRETAFALHHLGAEVTVWAPAPERQSPADDPDPFTVRRIPMRGSQDWPCRLRMARALWKAFPAGRVPGVMVLAEPGPLRLYLYQDLLKLPRPDRCLLLFHGTEALRLSARWWRRRALQDFLSRVDAVAAVSSYVGDFLSRQFRLPGEPILLPGAVPHAYSNAAPFPLPSGRGRVSLLQVGRLSPRKGQLDLCEALACLPDAFARKLQVTIAGPEGPSGYVRKVKARATGLNIPVEFPGCLPPEALAEAYREADIVVMPSRPHGYSLEGLGITLLEGAHWGRPVIGTRFGGVPEAMIPDRTGLLVPPGDPRALAEALSTLIEDEGLRSAFGAAGAAFVRSTFSWAENARRLLAIPAGSGSI